MKRTTEIVFETGQQQAVASWINYLNQIRLDQLMESLNNLKETYDLNGAMRIINNTMKQIEHGIIERNRGGQDGMHDFIAECAEVGINNAWDKYKRQIPQYIWLNDNGPSDIQKGSIFIQQKFYNSNLSLEAVKKHLAKYPDYLKNGGKYQIPKDQLDKVKELLKISEEEANKLPTGDGTFSMKQWRLVHQMFDKEGWELSDFEEARLDYKSAQRGTIFKVLKKEKEDIKEEYNTLKDAAYEESKPTFQEGIKAAEVAAIAEGGMTFAMAIIKKIKAGKNLSEFSTDDWEEILKDTGISTVKGGIRGASIYMLTNYTATPAAVASSIVTASFGIANQAHLLRKGEISDYDFMLNAQMVCVDASVSALSSFIGQAVIPIPVIGAVIGNTVGTMMYQIAKDNLSKYEQKLISQYVNDIKKLDQQLDKQYRVFITGLVKELKIYYTLLDAAFSSDYQTALDGSVSLALSVGVPIDKVLKNKAEIDNYFMM